MNTKKIVLSLFCTAAVALVTSCSKATSSMPTGVVLLDGSGLYEEQADGSMKYVSSANAGDVFNLVIQKGTVEQKAAKRTDGKERTFYHVEKDGSKTWIQNALFAPNTHPIIFIDTDAVMYSAPEVSAVTNRTFPQYLIAAAGESKKDGFVRIYAYIDGVMSATDSEVYAKNTTISRNENDVKAYQMLLAARKVTNLTAKKELLKNAKDINSSFDDLIQSEFNAAFPDEAITSESNDQMTQSATEAEVTENAADVSTETSSNSAEAASPTYGE